MAAEEKQPTPEREQTDESLRVEREKADNALVESQSTLDTTADDVISKARALADEIVAAARAKTDQQTSSSNEKSWAKVEQKRELEDEAVQEERAEADEVVRVERAEHIALLSRERDETDKDLLVERTRSDHALATRDEFLGIVSHDLRDLLGAMVGFASLIEDAEQRDNHSHEVLAHVERIRRSGARMNRLIGDLVDLASIEAGSLAVTREVVDPAAVLAEAIETAQSQALANGVTLSSELMPASTLASLDPARILQVLGNLLSNALKFSPANGKVVVRLEQVGDELRFAVSDTGVGIPADKLETVFERFRQINTNDRRGVGLGLYISKCIVQGHGGRIWAESTTGEGSTFYFTLPIDTREGGRVVA